MLSCLPVSLPGCRCDPELPAPRVALAQISPRLGDLEADLRAHLANVISGCPIKSAGVRGRALGSSDAWVGLLRPSARFHTVWIACANRLAPRELRRIEREARP